MILAFPCARCGRQVVHVGPLGELQHCACGSVFFAASVSIGAVPGISLLMGRPVERDRYDSKCGHCGEPVGLAGYPALALFRTLRCDGWHVVDLCGQRCAVCDAPLPIETDESLTPIWR